MNEEKEDRIEELTEEMFIDVSGGQGTILDPDG
jgi:hypothetical protein